ncbi:uncharacterized protein [Apostichopus japonicus]|uniref:uncharacterized protein isoform X2 n=1 Tax=Stichopus japonicus TaxID=307972 RepID=UPI003AB3D66C
MASKVWPNWSFSRTFFIYDHEIVKREEDDPKLALVYFYPESPHVSEDAQCLFSGQVMAMVSFMQNLVASKPQLYCLKKMKIATMHEGRFTMALASSFNTPDAIALQKLRNLCNLFKFFQGSVQRIMQEHSGNHDAFVDHVGKVMPFFLSFARYHDNKVRETFQDIPMVLLPKKSHLVYLKASHLLQWLKRRPSLLAGCIIYKHKVLCTQLTSSITRFLLTVKSKHQLPAITVSVPFELPVGVQILVVFLKDEDYSVFGKSKQRSGQDRRIEHKADVKEKSPEESDQDNVLNLERREANTSSVERFNKKNRYERRQKSQVSSPDQEVHKLNGHIGEHSTDSNLSDGTNREMYRDEDNRLGIDKEEDSREGDREGETDGSKFERSIRSENGVGFSDRPEILSSEMTRENGKDKDTVEIRSILKRTEENNDGVVTVIDTPSRENNNRKSTSSADDGVGVGSISGKEVDGGLELALDAEVGKGGQDREYGGSKSSAVRRLDLTLNSEDGGTTTDEDSSKCNIDSERIPDAMGDSSSEEKSAVGPSLGASTEIIEEGEQNGTSKAAVEILPVETATTNLSESDLSVKMQSDSPDDVSLPGESGSHFRDLVHSGEEKFDSNSDDNIGVNRSHKVDEYVNISLEKSKEDQNAHQQESMLELQEEDTFSEWPPMGQRSISSASFMSSRRTSMFTDDGKSRSGTDDSEDMFDTKVRSTGVSSEAKVGGNTVLGMVDVSLYIQIHSEDLTVIFLAENSLQKDEKEINNIWQTIWSQSAQLEKELKQSDEVVKTESSTGGCNRITFNTFEHSLTTKFEASTPSDDGRFFQGARLLHNEFNKDAELKKVHLGTGSATVIGDQDFGNQQFQHILSSDSGLSLTKPTNPKAHGKVKVMLGDRWGLL